MAKLKVKIVDFFGTIFIRILMDLKDIVEVIISGAITVIVGLIIVNFFFMPVKVVGTSMVPTLENANYGFSSIIARRVDGIERFDIVVIELDNERLVKRVIGLPGESIWYVNDILYINGNPIDEDFLKDDYVKSMLDLWGRECFTGDFEVVSLGEDEYFCLGDNRLVSSDSRYYGAFKAEQIVSKDIFIIYPFKNFGNK